MIAPKVREGHRVEESEEEISTKAALKKEDEDQVEEGEDDVWTSYQAIKSDDASIDI